MADRYGDYDLRLNDNDARHRWGGKVVSTSTVAGAAATNSTGASGANTVVADGPVRRLQRDLIELGFLLRTPAPDGKFDHETQWAVREFQIYAGMATVAQQNAMQMAVLPSDPDYVDALSATNVPRADVYTGPRSGVTNADTRRILNTWLNERRRCPVVAEAWTMRGETRVARTHSSIWKRTEPGTTDPRVYVRDFTGTYTAAAAALGTGRDLTQPIVLGDYGTSIFGNGPRGAAPQHVWSESEVTPERLCGGAWATLSAQEQCLFKVLRAVSEVESFGYFEVGNAYDSGVLSTGIFQWTTSSAGLPELLNLLKTNSAADFASFFGAYGLDVLTVKGQQRLGLEQEGGGHARADDSLDQDYFRTWHWLYRFAMVNRLCRQFQRIQRDRGRERFAKFINEKWDTLFGASGGTQRPATIGQMYTSERAMAILLRWHVNRPVTVRAKGGGPGNLLRDAYARAQAATSSPLVWTDHPMDWTQEHEDALVTGLLQAAENTAISTIRSTTPQVNGFWSPTLFPSLPSQPTTWAERKITYRWRLPSAAAMMPPAGELSTTRGSFQIP